MEYGISIPIIPVDILQYIDMPIFSQNSEAQWGIPTIGQVISVAKLLKFGLNLISVGGNQKMPPLFFYQNQGPFLPNPTRFANNR